MAVSPEQVRRLVSEQVALISQPDLRAFYEVHAVAPSVEMRDWDYGESGQKYPCWLVWRNEEANTGIAYCELGFGPGDPWGLLFLRGEYMSMGMDSGWFMRLEDALRNSPGWEGQDPHGFEIP